MADWRRSGVETRALRTLWAEGSMAVRSDADLIRVFAVGHREAAEAAFEALLSRHGPMVLGVCRRILRDEHAAEDAFQAVFLILARKARSVRVDDSLGRWLHGVTRRVALRAKGSASREIPASILTAPKGDPVVELIRAEVRQGIGQEVARLPRKYREVVALCHLDGLSHDGAAEALGVPVGTVRSRLSRAREILRVRLVRRGLAPSTLACWLGARPAAAVPNALMANSLRNAGGVATVAVPPSVLALTTHAMRSYSMAKALTAGALVAALGCLTAGAVVLARGGDEPPKAPTSTAQIPGSKQAEAPTATLKDQFRRIVKEYDETEAHARQVASKAGTNFERSKILGETLPEVAGYARRIVDLALTNPADPASRDALIWVVYKPSRSDGGAYGDEFARAVRLLVDHHADDPEVARLGLKLENLLSRNRDAFLEGIYAGAQCREAKGLIRLAMAQYLVKKAEFVADARKFPGRGVAQYEGYDDQGKLVEMTSRFGNEEEGYRVHMRMLDPDFVHREGERLFEEVIAEYADVPFISIGDGDLERLARETPSSTVADPEEKLEMIEIEQDLATRPPTLGEIAAQCLDDLRNLAIGKVAPDFEGQGVDGKPIKLSDHRGKVVVVLYWFSGCGPCLREIPHDRELALRMKGRPFALLGVVTDGRADEARKVIEAEGMTWPNVLVGGDKVAERYHVSSNPAYFVLDAAGVIRSKGYTLPSQLDKLVEKLVGETEASAQPTLSK